MREDAATMPQTSFTTLVLEDLLTDVDPADRSAAVAAASARLVEARQADAARLGATVRCYATAALDPKADLATFVSIFEEGSAGFDPDQLSDAGTRLRNTARYRLRNVMPGSAESSEATGVLVGITDCSDDARLDEFNHWYDESHAADVIRSGKYQRGRRFEGIESPLGSFLALYETSGTEPETFKSYLAWPERDRSRCEVFVVRQVFTLRRIG
jgi:hypothetical protein